MQIPPDALLPFEKLTQYLLVARLEDDKSQFLSQAGFHLENSRELELAVRKLTSEQPAIEDGRNEYGVFYRNDGELTEPNGVSLPTTLIWIQLDGDDSFRFVTLKPRRIKR